MSTTLTKYNQVSELLSNGLIDLDSDTIKVALVTSAYTLDLEHDEWADASASELVDASYASGGATLGTTSLSRTGAVTTFDAADTTYTTLTGTFRYGVIYVSGTFGAYTNPLLGVVLFNDAPADVTSSGLDFSILWNASGIFTIT